MDSPASKSTPLNRQPVNSFKPSFFRRRMVVDREAQYTYLVYAILTGCLFVCFDIATSVLWHLMIGSLETVSEIPKSTLIATVLAIACLGIVVILIAVIAANLVSNRLAGPVWRLNSHLKRVVAGNEIHALEFRAKDQFHEVAENYNLLLIELKELRSKHGQTTGSKSAAKTDQP